MSDKINLLDFNYQKMQDFFVSLGEKSYRAQQIMQWIYQKHNKEIAEMSNLGKKLQTKLLEIAHIIVPSIIKSHQSTDGTLKWLIKLSCGNCIETVFIPEINRGTLCVSSQVGCALNCSFCATAKEGFNRNLTTAEIISQIWLATQELCLQKHPQKITNVVMMGMGEPLLNFENVVNAMDIMMHDFAYGLSKRRVTLSTSGVLPMLEQLQEISPVSLAVSLHAPNDELRNQLVPINKKYPLKELMLVCKNYFKKEPRRKITFEYVMLDGINDKLEHAKELIKLLQDIPAKVNLIPFNPFPYTTYKRSSAIHIKEFSDKLYAHGINVITRKTRGDDINAACGQLAGEIQDRTKRSIRWKKNQEELTTIHVPLDSIINL